MKKIAFFAVALGALMVASCGNKTNGNGQSQDSDSVSFEQSQIEEKMMIELDSLSEASMKLKPIDGIFANGKIQLSEDELKAKPNYLLDTKVIDGLSTLSQKYRALGMIAVDRQVAALYKMDVDAYDAIGAKIATEVNDPAIKVGLQFDTVQIKQFFETEKKAGRVNYIWEASTAVNIETLYIICQNIDKFITAFDDESASNITYHIALMKLGLDDLANYDKNIKALDDAIAPVNEINAISVAQLKDQLTKIKPEIEAARAALLK